MEERSERSGSVVDRIIASGIVEEIVDNIGVIELYRDDLVQETYLILLEYDKDKLNEIEEKGDTKFFVSKVITNQINSKTSRFYYKYKKYYKNKDENRTITDGVEDVDD